jgi:hypothetical protein
MSKLGIFAATALSLTLAASGTYLGYDGLRHPCGE